MLSPYARTNAVNAGLALKVNISDTSSMLSPYLRKIDTASLSNRINLKVNISDTSAMLSPYLRSATASATYVPQSRTITINGTSQDLSANRTFSVGTVTSVGLTAGTGISVSGSPVTGSGSMTVTNTAPDQTVVLNSGTGISISGTYPSFTITNSSPSSGGTVTSVGTNNGTGLTGGTITTAGTLAIDTALISTRLWRQKGIDSVQSNLTAGLALKVNISDTSSMLSPYLRKVDTASLSNRINLKVNISDTSNMLNPYARKNFINAGTGISYSSSTGTIANTAPDQTVALTGGTGISISGTYPNFTITNSSPSSGGTVTSVGSGTGLTGGPITTSGTLAVDTLLMSTRAWRQKGIDSVQANLTAGLALKLNISDTANMLSPYLRKVDTTSLSNRINLKLNISDTSSMLTNYFRINGVGLNRAGQTVLADTLLLSTRAWRQKGIDSVASLITSGYVPYTGATTNVDLGTHTLTAKNLVINHASGSGVAASITKGGNGEALTISKTSGSGNAMSVSGGLTSLVDLSLSSISNATTDTDRFLVSDGGVVKYRTGAEVLSDIGGQAALTNPVTGTGTTNYIPKFTSSSAIGNSQIFDNGTNVGIGTATPAYKLDVSGTSRITTPSGSEALIITGRASDGASQISINNASNSSLAYIYTTSSELRLFANTGLSQTFYTGGALRATLDASGNLGLGVTPSAWYTTGGYINYQVGNASLVGRSSTNSEVYLGANYFVDNTPSIRYITSDFATRYAQINGQHQWYTAPSGTAGNAITFTQAMTLNASGRLLLGTTSDDGVSRLQVSGTIRTFSGNLDLISNNVTANFYDSGNSDYLYSLQNYSSQFRLYNNNTSTTVLNFASTGAATFSSSVTATQFTSQADNAYYRVRRAAGTDVGYITDSGTWGDSGTDFSIGASSANLRFYTNNSITERMRLDASGNLGLGTTSPAYKLDVVISSGPYNTRFHNSSTSTSDYNAILVSQGASGSATGYFGTGGSAAGNTSFANTFVIGTQSNSAFVFNTNDTERMRITSGGNVGIGTTTIGSTLQVNGNAAIGYSASTAAPTNGLAVSGRVGLGTTTPNYRIEVITADNVNVAAASFVGVYSITDYIVQRVAAGTTGYGAYTQYSDGTYNMAIGSATNGDFTFISGRFPGSAGTERWRVTLNGENQLKPAANTAALTSSTYSLTGSNASSLLDLAGTWNTTGNPTAIKLNITNTASGATARLMDLQVGGTSEFVVNKIGQVGINTGSPNSFLHVAGSVRFPYSLKTATYTLDSTDYTVRFDCVTAAANLTANLPDATTCTGRIYTIISNSDVNYQLTVDGNGGQTIGGDATIILDPCYNGATLVIQSDGSNWQIISFTAWGGNRC
jgi:hypothetical protein